MTEDLSSGPQSDCLDLSAYLLVQLRAGPGVKESMIAIYWKRPFWIDLKHLGHKVLGLQSHMLPTPSLKRIVAGLDAAQEFRHGIAGELVG